MKKIGEKIGETAVDVAQTAKDTKDAAITEVKEDTKLVKEKLAAGVDTATEAADSAKEKTTKEAKKAKEKTSGFFFRHFQRCETRYRRCYR